MKEKEEQSKRQTEPVYSKTYTVEPAEGNGQQELPLTLLAKRILEVATLHAPSKSNREYAMYMTKMQ